MRCMTRRCDIYFKSEQGKEHLCVIMHVCRHMHVHAHTSVCVLSEIQNNLYYTLYVSMGCIWQFYSFRKKCEWRFVLFNVDAESEHNIWLLSVALMGHTCREHHRWEGSVGFRFWRPLARLRKPPLAIWSQSKLWWYLYHHQSQHTAGG